MQRQNMIFIFFIAFLLVIFVGYIFVIGYEDTDEEELKECYFSKSYTLIGINESNDDDYVFVTLKDLIVDDVFTVKIKLDDMPTLIEGNNYLFSFNTDKKIHDSMIDIFTLSNIVDIEDIEKEENAGISICETHLINE